MLLLTSNINLQLIFRSMYIYSEINVWKLLIFATNICVDRDVEICNIVV